jgi:3-oxoisoapionate decarboxylase
MGFTVSGRALGRGMLPIEVTLSAAEQSGRCASAIIEVWTPPEPEIGATLAKEARWAEESVS